MRYQQNDYSCGPAAIVNALKCFGRHYRERTVQKLCGTTQEGGTDEKSLLTGIRALNWRVTELKATSRPEAFQKLWTVLDDSAALLCVDNDSHWITAIGKIGRRIVIADPKNTVKNRKENGVHVVPAPELIRRWRNAGNEYYGLVIHPIYPRRLRRSNQASKDRAVA